MSSENSAARRIPSIESTDSTPIFRGFTLNDIAVVGWPFSLYLVGFQFIPPWGYLPGLVAVVVLSMVGGVFVLTAPNYYSSSEWVTHHISHYIRADEYFNIPLQAEHKHREQKQEPEHGLVTSVFATDQRTQDVLGIDRIIPTEGGGTGAVQMRDGSLCAALKVEPANLTLAEPVDWRNATQSLATFVNKLDFPVKMYQTHRQFDTEQFIEPYEQRRMDDDVLAEPALEEVLTAFLDWYPDRIETRNTTISEYYLIVGVSQPEVESESRESGVADQIPDIPVISDALSSDDDDEIPESVIRGRQRDQLFERVQNVKGRIREIDDISAKEIPCEEHAEIISRAWTRKDIEGDVEDMINNTPVVHHESERTVNEMTEIET